MKTVITPAVRERTDARRNLILPSPNSFTPLPQAQAPDRCHPLGQQRPGDARHLVGKRHRDHLERFAGEKLCEPRILLRLMARVSQYRAGSDHQNASQIAIASFRDRPELLFAAGQIFARHEPDPGREVTTRSENLRNPGRSPRSRWLR